MNHSKFNKTQSHDPKKFKHGIFSKTKVSRLLEPEIEGNYQLNSTSNSIMNETLNNTSYNIINDALNDTEFNKWMFNNDITNN